MGAEGDRSAALPWWLEEGEELCDHCLILYRFEAGFRCVECDLPLCPSCLGRVAMGIEVVCPTCSSAPEDGG